MTRFPQGPGSSPGFLLWRVTLAWQRAITSALQPLALTHVQFVLLACTWWLEEQGQPPTQVEVARQAGTDVKMTSQVIRKLELSGLLERRVDPADTRARRLTLTAQGRRRLKRAIAAVEQADADYFGEHASAAAPLLQRLLARGG